MKLETHIGLKRLPGLNAFFLHKEEVEALWDLLEPMIESSIHHAQGMITTAGVKAGLQNEGYGSIIVLRNDMILCYFVFRVVPYEQYKALRVVVAAGKELKAAFERIDVLIDWALKQGCVEIEGWCRPVMVRMLRKYQFKPKSTLVTLDIRRRMH